MLVSRNCLDCNTTGRPSASVGLHPEVRNSSLCCVRPGSTAGIMCFGRVVETCRGASGRYCASRDLRQYQHGSAGTSARAQMNKTRSIVSSGTWCHPGSSTPPVVSPGVLGTWQGTSGGSPALSCISGGDTSASVGRSSSPSCSRQGEISLFVREWSPDADHCVLVEPALLLHNLKVRRQRWLPCSAKKTDLLRSFSYWFGWLIFINDVRHSFCCGK